MNNKLFIKDTFKFLLIAFVIILTILPFATTLDEFMTAIIRSTPIYMFLQHTFVPYVSSILYVLLSHAPGIQAKPLSYGVWINGIDVIVGWNCLGWQSFLIFFVSLAVGIKRRYSTLSKIIVILMGIAGTFIVNILRLAFTAGLVAWHKQLFMILFHNYFASFVTIIWLFVFWWFAYRYLLEEKKTILQEKR
jgi:exosortase/archaeosortase family protein